MKIYPRLITFLLLCFALVGTGSSVYSQAPAPTAPAAPDFSVAAQVIDDASAKAKGWQRFQFGVSPKFSAILPLVPSNVAKVLEGQVVNSYISSSGPVIYAVARVDRISTNLENSSEEARTRYFNQFFQGFAKSFESQPSDPSQNMKLLDVTKVTTAAGREGYQQRLSYKTWQGLGQMVFVGNSALCLVSLWSPTAPADDYNSFFASFRITN